jgi:Fe-S-cluster containining protein
MDDQKVKFEPGMIAPGKLAVMARAARQEHAALVKRLSAGDSRKLDARVHALHEAVFDTIDCLDCANCCRTLGPRITDADVRRMAAALRIRPSVFVERFLVVDEEGDYIFRSMPCPFLGSDNYCSVYDVRPRACRDYPHTDRPRVYQVMALTLKNSSICPAVFEILERLKKGE